MREPKPKKEIDGNYHIRFRVKDKNGKLLQKHFSRSEWKSGKDAIAFYRQYIKDAGYETHGLTVNDLFKIYIKDQPMRLRSKQNNQMMFRLYIELTIGKMTVDNIGAKQIRAWQSELAKTVSEKTGRPFTDGYLKKIQTLLRTSLNYAEKYEYIERNPFKIPNLKKEQPKKAIRHLTVEQFRTLIQHATAEKYADLFTVMYWTGMRYGEVIGLRMSDIDLENGTLSVNKTYDYVNGIDTELPKSENSYRKVIMTTEVKNIVSRLCKCHSRSIGYNSNTLLFGFDEHYSKRAVEFALDRTIRLSGVPRITLHGFRHSHVFFLRKAGFDAFEIAKRIGDEVTQVNKTYGQWFDDSQKEMAARIDELAEIGMAKIEKPSDNVAEVLQRVVGKA